MNRSIIRSLSISATLVYPICLLALAASCDSTRSDADLDAGFNDVDYIALFEEGAAILTTEPVTVFKDPQTPIGTAPAGATGIVLRSKLKNGVDWSEIDFEVAGQVDGFVEATRLAPIGLALPPVDHVIGFLGCSMTRDKGAGLNLYTAIESWDKFADDGTKVMTQYSGGTIDRWSLPGENGYNNKWSAFQDGLMFWPATDLILWEICIRIEEVTADPADYLERLEHVSLRLAEEAPGIPVFVTGMVPYETGMDCSITGPNGVAFAAELAALAVAEGYALPATGLTLGPLGPDQVIEDGCHANTSGMEAQALQIEAWLKTMP
jgi:hypothetical protein